MKRLITLCLSCLILIGLFSCANVGGNGDGISIVTTCFPLYDFAREIIGKRGEVTLLLKPGQDAHSYAPSAKDIVKIKNCDLFLCIGGEDEAWVDTLLSGSDLNNVRSLSLIEHVPLLSDGHSHDDGHDHTYDEHIWTSPKKAAIMVEHITAELVSIFPEEKEYFESNMSAYLSALSSLDSAFTELVSKAERSTVVFGDRFPFLYLTEEYGIEYHSVFTGCSDMTEPSASAVAELISIINEHNIPTVFITELSNGKIADSICAQTGAVKAVMHSCANLTKSDKENGETYISLMTKNLEALRNALS